MSFALLAAAIPGALQLGQTLINKPKREDFRPNTAGMEKYISYLRGRTAKSEVAHQAMQPQLRAIGAQNRQTERKIQSAVGRGNLSASEEAQLQISQGQAATAATQAVGEQATALQTQENRRIGEQVAQAQARIAQAKEQGNLDFERATKDYKNQIKGSLLNIGAGVASAGIGDYLTKQATSKSAFDAYKAAGLSEFGSAEELAKASTDLGIGDSRQFVNMKLNEQKVKSAFSGFSPEEISAAGQKLYGTSEFDIGKDLSTEGAQQLLSELSGQRTNTVMDISEKIANNEITSVDQIKNLNVSDQMKVQLSNQLASQKASLADPIDRAIGNAIQNQDKAGLVKVMETPDISEKDYKTALNAHSSIVNAEIKAANDLREETAKKLELSTTEQNQIKTFAGKSGTLLSSIESYSTSVGGDKSGFLDKVKLIRNGTAITSAEQDDLNKSARTFVQSMQIGKKVNGITVKAPASILDLLGKAGIDVNAKSEVSIVNGFQSLIEQLRTNSVELSEEQQVLFNNGMQVGEFDNF
jgi:hypothetical protein